MVRQPVVEQVCRVDGPRALSRRRLRRFNIFILPQLLPLPIFAVGAALFGHPRLHKLGALLMLAGGLYFVVWTLADILVGSVFRVRCFLLWLRDHIDLRPDAFVRADDPEALFVEVIPRDNWSVTSTKINDLGLLVIDSVHRELRYEGDLERWTIPVESIQSFAVHSVVPPEKIFRILSFSVVLLTVQLSGGSVREMPLATMPSHFRLWHPRRKRAQARVLAGAIGHLVDPARWPRVDSRQLSWLRPPPRPSAAVDFG